MNKNDLKFKAEAVLDKVKSMANIRNTLKSIETKLAKIKIQVTLDNTQTKKELNTRLKIKFDADTRQAGEKVKNIHTTTPHKT